MPNLPGVNADVYFGDTEKPLPDWAPGVANEDADSDEISAEDRAAVHAILGFDISEIENEQYRTHEKVERYFAGRIGDDVRVDFEKRAIYGVAIATIGPALKSSRVEVDRETLNQIEQFAANCPVRSRMDHPESRSLQLPGVDGKVEVSGKLEDVVGTFENFRVSADKVVADFYAVPERALAGKRATGLLHLAADKRASQTFGVSILCNQVIQDKKIRVTALHAIDWVDIPALNPTGVFSGESTMPPFKISKGTDGKYSIKFDADCKAGAEYAFDMPADEKKPEEEKPAPAANAADEDVKKKADEKAAADKAAANSASAGAKSYSAADLEAAKLEGKKEAKNYSDEFNAVMDASKLAGKEREDFAAAFSGYDIKAVKFHASKLVEARTHAVGSDHGATAGKAETDAVARFSSSVGVRTLYGCASDDKNSKEWKDALAEYLKVSTGK